MKKSNKLGLFISLIIAVTALVTTVLALTVVFTKKRKDEEELERYLDCSIQ